MHKRLALLPLATLLAIPSVAAAQDHALVATAPPPAERRNEIDIGFIVGGLDIGTTRRLTRGLQLNAGRRFGDVALLGEYQYLAIGRDSADSQARMSRGGVMVRYSLLRTKVMPHNRKKHGHISGDFWIEGGVGLSRTAWDRGGVLTRPDLAFGFGAQLDKIIDRRADRPRMFGPYVAFRAQLSRSPEESDGMPVCGGPCDEPTLPSNNNVGLFLHFGVNWGK